MKLAAPAISLSCGILLSVAPAVVPEIPWYLTSASSPDHLRFGYQEGTVHSYSSPPTLKISWTASALTNREPDPTLPISYVDGQLVLGTHTFSNSEQRFRVGFAPTASAVVDKSSLLVAGVDHAGNTIIEKWTLVYGFAAPPIKVDPASGLSRVDIALPEKGAVTRLYSGNESGKQFVRNLCALRTANSNSTGALVQFDDSGDVYRLDLQSGALTFLAGSSSGVLGAVPSLSQTLHRLLSFGSRPGYGYVYSLIADVSDDSASVSTPSVLFMDSDEDGVIDGQIELSDAAYAAQGWLDVRNYGEYWSD